MHVSAWQNMRVQDVVIIPFIVSNNGAGKHSMSNLKAKYSQTNPGLFWPGSFNTHTTGPTIQRLRGIPKLQRRSKSQTRSK
jgi:hypothetical protein